MKPRIPPRYPVILTHWLRIVFTLPLIVAVLTPPEVGAQDGLAVNDYALGRCRLIQDIAARAACYDGLVDTQSQSSDAQRLMIENQRLRDAMARQRSAEETEAPAELVDTIAALDKRPDGWVVTLQNGQIWQQHVSRRYELRVGQQVRIYPTIFGGGYKLTAPGKGGFIYVKRAR